MHDMLVNEYQRHVPAIKPLDDIRRSERHDFDRDAGRMRLGREMLLHVERHRGVEHAHRTICRVEHRPGFRNDNTRLFPAFHRA